MGFFCYIHKQTSNKSYYLNESQTQIEKVVLNAATGAEYNERLAVGRR